MEAPASTREHTAPVPARVETTTRGRRDDRGLAMLFLSVVLTIYIVIGVAMYKVVAALV